MFFHHKYYHYNNLKNLIHNYFDNVNYNFYISNYPTSTIAGITPYNITFKNS